MTVLTIKSAPSGSIRDNHWVIPNGATRPVRTLLTEPQRTNLLIRSQEFDTWTQVGATTTPNVAMAPDGTTTADSITAIGTGNYVVRSATFTGDGEKCVSCFIKQGATTRQAFVFRDTTAAVSRHYVRATWSGGVPSLSSAGGTGTLFPPQSIGNGWWRVMFSVTGVVAANSNEIRVYPDDLVGGNDGLFWGAQAENAVVPSSYIPTEAAAVTRNADSLYWEIPSLVPQELTAYWRGIDMAFGGAVAGGNTLTALTINNAAGAAPRLNVSAPAATSGLAVTHQNSSTVATASTGTRAYGAILEARAVLASTGAVRIGVSVADAAEVESSLSTAEPLAAAFSATRLYLGSAGTIAASQGVTLTTHIAIAPGTHTRTTMRKLARVTD